MASILRENWQNGKSLQECNLHLMEMEYSDIIFRLYYKSRSNGEVVVDIPALRLLCLARSPVFFAMFNGELAQQKDNHVFDIHDDFADPEAFKQMIRFMYSDDVVLTADNVLSILYLSQKYIVSTLTKRCLQFLEASLNPDTAPVLLEQSMLYEEKELKDKTLELMTEEAPEVLASDEFMNMSRQALSETLKLNLKVRKELTVFEACMKWAKNQCQTLKKAPSGENIRQVLGNNLYQIRFPTMSAAEFTDVVIPQDVLSAEEGRRVLTHISSGSSMPENLPFLTDKRWDLDCSSQRTILIASPKTRSTDELSNGTSAVTFLSCTVSKPLCLRGILIHADRYSSSKYVTQHLCVTLSQNGNCLLRAYTGRPCLTARPSHYAVDVDDVRVESGVVELSIELRLSVSLPNGQVRCGFNYSSPYTYQLSDDYVTITFPPNSKNLLLGINYRVP